MCRVVPTLMLLLVSACAAEVDPMEPAPGCRARQVSTPLAPETAEMVDVLFVIDTSSDNYSEQAVFANALPGFMDTLAGTGEFSPDIHVGFITADLGTGGHVVPTCEEPNFGDDARLHRTLASSCADDLSPVGDAPYLSFRADSTQSLEDLTREAVCITYGYEGCGLEQPLDAVLKALTPSASSLRFAGGTLGHASEANDGFLREDAVLAVVLLANEDDCSVRDAELFDRTSTVYTEPDLSLRCFLHEDALHPLARYVEGLLAVRPAERLVFAAIAGVPEEIASSAESTPWDLLVGDASVRDPRMIVTVDAATGTGRCAACGHVGRGESHAAVRIASVARDLEARGVRTGVHSICAETYEPAMSIIADQILEAMSGACLDMSLDVDEEGSARCDVVEAPSDGVCEGRHGRVPWGVSEDGTSLCKLCRGDGEGHVIDDDPACRALGQAGWSVRASSVCSDAQSVAFAPLLPTSPRLLCPDPDPTSRVCD
ncbi:MAG: hypothetical protein AB8H86_04580 [Polyangiales bacterium]